MTLNLLLIITSLMTQNQRKSLKKPAFEAQIKVINTLILTALKAYDLKKQQ